MTKLIALAFNEEFKAAEAKVALLRMQREALLAIEDFALVVKHPDGRLQLLQEVDLVQQRANQVHYLAFLVGMAMGISMRGLTGTRLGVLASKVTEYSIDNLSLTDLTSDLQPGSSVLFVLGGATGRNRQQVVERLSRLGGTLLYTQVPDEDQQELRTLLSRLNATAPGEAQWGDS